MIYQHYTGTKAWLTFNINDRYGNSHKAKWELEILSSSFCH